MLAYRLCGPGDTRLVEVAEPEPGPTEALLKVLAVGVCHSDLNVRSGVAGTTWRMPYTLGHEVCAEVVQLGSGVTGLSPGQQVVVHGPLGCGECHTCTDGDENLCPRKPATASGVGLGVDGGMASLLVTQARRLVPADGLDPVSAAPLTDAALTSLHAISMCRSLDADGALAVVVGVGGLGHLAVQLLRALTPATIVAVDIRPEARDLAVRCGAHHVLDATTELDKVVRNLSSRNGADAVLDFVVAPSHVETSARLLSTAADLVLVGGGGGELRVRKPGTLPPDTRITVPSWGTRNELAQLVGLARQGRLEIDTTVFPLIEADEAFSRLESGGIQGRAVLVP
ncbi:alcohol dehydrogenase catalytic domain-containing protein [Streptomyces rapamycinicus]|uniref:alcohol dehydrogenase n=2 Tax=Streptomyces rapamycinicus TaxID=1226757 RepID=A0A0A0N727_STRRN|nr:alcohol dehydrogenase catalytic domain-containing protein [Streptomyces rapamycinicus]AGP51763.1 hypothetical protein M271_00620 [Streptomyces rapamycinicus NRRL 5491]MBB4779174.1 propanol-preferring alcohol dehydrogenase [Streptomyces rapamycinicus]RLV76158.1 hypothetical protein D3C57_143070 [Streptomyces rapamycinicus NRRL 5491]UTP27989.1 alcohol dehydrogenase catalytic domain-containing protein [Streptomyces rapamycinicus NRRL 5491]